VKPPFSTTDTPMKKLTLTQKEYLEVAEYFLWALSVHFTVWFTGSWKRWKRTEYNLPRMVKKGALKTAKYGTRLAYTLPGRRAEYTQDIDHGIICTESLLRFKLSQPGEIISERFFRSLSFEAVPEWGVIYPSGNMLLFEYSTSDNCRRSRVMRKKLTNIEAVLDLLRTISRLAHWFYLFSMYPNIQ
jgi:hypothetical protein